MKKSGPLQRRFARYADAATRARGVECLAAGRLTEVQLSDARLSGESKDGKRYRPFIETEPTLDWDCACPAGHDGRFCEHLWALALYGDQHHLDPFLDVTDEDEDEEEAGPVDAVQRDPEALPSERAGSFDRRAAPASRVNVASDARARELAFAERARWQGLLPALGHPVATLLEQPQTETWYIIDEAYSPYAWRFRQATLKLVLVQRRRLKNGRVGKPTTVGQVPARPPPPGAEGLIWTLASGSPDSAAYLSSDLACKLLPELCALGRVGISLTVRGHDIQELAWDAGGTWRLVLEIEGATENAEVFSPMQLTGTLERGEGTARETLPLSRVQSLFDVGLFTCEQCLCVLEPGHARWVRELRRGPLRLLEGEFEGLIARLLANPSAPKLRNPEAVGFLARREAVRGQVRLKLPGKAGSRVEGSLSFRYGDTEVGREVPTLKRGGRVLVRDFAAETALVEQLQTLGFRVTAGVPEPGSSAATPFALELPGAEVVRALDGLRDLGVAVFVEGQPYRRATAWHPIIESEQDWFNLKGEANFDGQSATLPQLLAAVRKKERWIRLSDGTLGRMPDEWMPALERLAELLPHGNKAPRLHVAQALMVEGALSGATELTSDEGFRAARQRFERFSGIEPLPEPKGFVGELRPYQRVALGWLEALDELGLGGCLADDMGLGKTVVVLAWLQRAKERRAASAARREAKPAPSLLVVPKSLLFNWLREAERFTPELQFLLHHGLERKVPGPHFSQVDVVLTSYGTLRRDAEALTKVVFDTVILDEAHSIKNAWTGAHQTARALSSRRRLALTGTPLENHLGELWNLLSFLNPGVFDGFSHLRKTFEQRRPSQVALERVILTAVKPFVLRRTKAEVAPELPERVEKVVQVTLSESERKLYDELAAYYRRRILERKELNRGLRGHEASNENARHMAEALEGLLRLRQAACHPGLVDEALRGTSSSKLDVVVEHLSALREEGHKALVFSQFTSLLGLLAPLLDAAGIRYAYLDGKTRDREAVVRSFQDDPDVGAFLISLKAGGVGLNLVAADYVFLLDPWWNPASEAQAIDRAHRIGQTRKVIAYRILAKDTVEQKVAALQDEKRELVEALFGDTSQFAAKLTREDLEALLS